MAAIKMLIAVKSCRYDRDRGAHQVIRDTWGRDIQGAHLRFFMGQGGKGILLPDKSDEVTVEAPDDYPSLPYKTRAIARWALSTDFDFALFCDTGSFVIPHHLMSYGFEEFDYVGYWGMRNRTFQYTAENRPRGCPAVFIPNCHPWASGGGYILSRKAMTTIAMSEPTVWAEDLWVAQALAANEIYLTDKARDGYKGYVVDWIHLEKNDSADSLEKRREWMINKYEQARNQCATRGCGSWDRNVPSRIEPFSDPEAVERILRERREARKMRSQP